MDPLDELVKQLARDESPAEALTLHSVHLLNAVDATGAVLVYDKQIHHLGETPDDVFIEKLVNWLHTSEMPNLYETDRLPQIFEPAVAEKDKACGLLACRINRDLNEYILWFRPEILKTITGAGNPEKPATLDGENMTHISPRTFFESGSQTMRLTAEPWNKEDIQSASNLREELTFTINRKATELRMVNEKLKAAYEELDSFSYTISHDLKNPLSSIKGFTELLLTEETKEDELKFMLQRILFSANKMNTMIRDILTYSQTGRERNEYKVLDMAKILDEIKQELLTGQAQSAIQISIEQTPPFMGDETMVMQVFSNLVGNAVKYSLKRENPTVVVRGEMEANGVRYEIRDNGIGIPERDHDKIFDLFSRSEHAKEYEGTGVGLAIVKKLVEKHGGRIWMESMPNAGSTFFVFFKNSPGL